MKKYFTLAIFDNETKKFHAEFGDYDRGSRWRRVCISSLMGDMNE